MSTKTETLSHVFLRQPFFNKDGNGNGAVELSVAKKQRLPEAEVYLALHNQRAVSFVKHVLEDGYRHFFKPHEEEAVQMIERTFQVLAARSATINGESDDRYLDQLNEAFSAIHRVIFRKDDPSFWFNKIYTDYKRNVKSKKDFARIKEFIVGEKILDFGSGAGWFASELVNQGFKAATTDVLDYRPKGSKEIRRIPFYKMTSPVDIKYSNQTFDTTFSMSVLHHIDEENIALVIEKLSHITKRLIIKEDIVGPTSDIEGFEEAVEQQSLMKRFIDLGENVQKQSLILLDYFGNIIGQSIIDMNMPFQFKTVAQWKSLLSDNGFDTVKAILTGFETRKVHRSCEAFLICQSRRWDLLNWSRQGVFPHIVKNETPYEFGFGSALLFADFFKIVKQFGGDKKVKAFVFSLTGFF